MRRHPREGRHKGLEGHRRDIHLQRLQQVGLGISGISGNVEFRNIVIFQWHIQDIVLIMTCSGYDAKVNLIRCCLNCAIFWALGGVDEAVSGVKLRAGKSVKIVC